MTKQAINDLFKRLRVLAKEAKALQEAMAGPELPPRNQRYVFDGAKLTAARKSRGITQKQLGKHIGTSASQMYLFESTASNTRSSRGPSVLQLAAMSSLLSMTPGDLIALVLRPAVTEEERAQTTRIGRRGANYKPRNKA